MTTRNRVPSGLGLLFEDYAERGQPTRFILSRPFDIAPSAGTEHDIASLAGLVRDAAGWLHATGARPGDRVAVVKDNHWDYVLLACAAARLGAIPALLSSHLAADSIEMLLKRLEPAVLVTTAGILEAGHEAGVDLAGRAARTLALDGTAGQTLSPDDVRGTDPPGPRPRRPEEAMIVTHTSGTTGLPKLTTHSADTIIGHLGRTESIRWPVVAMRRDDTVATSVAFAHTRIIPWTTGTLRLGPRHALLVADPDPRAAERLFRDHPPSYLEALPSTFIRWQPLTRGDNNPFANVRLYISTFDAVHPPTVRRFLGASRRRFPTWFQGWGQSETGPLAFRLLTRRAMSRRGERHPTTRDLGRPIPFFTGLRVVDPSTMRPLPAGRPGMVLAKTRGRCLDYVGEPERWRAKARGPWWTTGDIGVRTRTGKILLLDREIDVIPGMSGVELEDVLADRIPAVLEAVVLGVPGRPPLPVVCTPDGRIDRDAWQRATHDLPPLAAPVVLTWAELPRTGTGKVRRLELREMLLGRSDTYGSGQWT